MRTHILAALALMVPACAGEISSTGGGGDDGAAVCGNGTVDTGEQCDDGNALAGDGCSAMCQTEQVSTPRVQAMLDQTSVTTELANAFKAANPSPAPDQVVGMITVVDVPKAEATPATSVLGSAYVGRAPVRSALSPDGATLWVTARGSNALVELDTATLLSTTCNPVRSETAVGPAPVGVTVLDGGKAVAVANSNRFQAPTLPQTVTFVSASSPVLLGQVTVGAFPRELDADATALFVSNFNSQSLSGLDLTKLALP